MPIEFKDSVTKDNLMRAFAGESQARNRYTIAADEAKKQKLHVVEAVFTFTANQEKEHAVLFYNHLKELVGQTIKVDGGYPVDLQYNVSELLRAAEHNEYEEHDDVYPAFANIAADEGFHEISALFRNIAKIEKTHGDRFKLLAEMMEQNKLFISDVQEEWACLNCGNIVLGNKAPMVCPVCQHEQGYFIRLSMLLLQ